MLEPLTHGASQINIYGAVNGSSVYRPNALTGDPNHLAIELLLPILILSPIYLRLERGHRLRTPLAVLIALPAAGRAGDALAQRAARPVLRGDRAARSRTGTCSSRGSRCCRSAWSRCPVAFELYRRRHFFSVVIRSRIQTGGSSTSAHLGVYDFIPQVLHQHPLFGLGFNNFSVYYEFVTGKTNWGPHSYYVMLIVEGGLVGTALFAVFLWWLFLRLRVARRLGQALAAAGDPLAARLRPLAWGMTAALVGTLASNAFYLTIPFLYFYVFVMLVLATPAVFSRR